MSCSGKPPEFRPAMDAPSGKVVTLDRLLVGRAVEESRRSPRGRIILPLHEAESDSLHRMLNALQPGSYVRPHRHREPPKAETIVVLQGAVCFVWFDDDGGVVGRRTLAAGQEAFGLDSRPGVFHTFFALEVDTVVFEVKPGPYDAATDKQFAPWAPEEGAPEASGYLERLAGEAPVLIREAREDDGETVIEMLRGAALPVADVEPRLPGFLVAVDGASTIVGAVALETHGELGLLRSLVVEPGRRRLGIGDRLIHALLRRARRDRLRAVYLLTTDAAGYFSRFGFLPRARNTAPTPIRRTRQFKDLCPETATLHTLPLD